MGEKFLVIKRVKPTELTGKAAEATPREDSQDDSTVSAGSLVCGPLPLEAPEDAPLVLSEAPVLRLVSGVAAATVANEVFGADTDTNTNDLNAASEAEQEIHELALVPLEGEIAYDGTPADAIDYHEDFCKLPGFVSQTVAKVTPMIPRLMAELSIVINERLASLGLAADSVQAQLMIATDPSTAEQLSADGYQPAIAVCTAPLMSLQQLRQVDVDAIQLRLVHVGTGLRCNQLFEDDFVLGGVAAAEDTQVTVENHEEAAQPYDPDGFAFFGDEQAGADAFAVSSPGEWQPGDTDIDDIFAEMDQFGLEEQPVVLDAMQAEASSNSVEECFEGFGEDVFAEELGIGGGQQECTPQAEIDELFDSLAVATFETDDICGVDVEEFSPAAEVEQAVPEAVAPVGLQESVAPEELEFSCIPAGITFSEASLGGGEIFPDFLEAFIEEGSSELEKLEDAVAAWEHDVASEAAYAVVSRILHTVKGIAKGVGLQFYGTLVHNFETLLGALPRPQAEMEGDYFRTVNAWLDACVRGLDHIQESRADISNVLPQLAGQLPVSGQDVEITPAEAPIQAPVVSSEPVSGADEARAKQLSKKIADDGARVLAAQQSVRITSEKLDDLLNLSNQAQQLSVRTAQSVTRGKRASIEMQTRLASVRAHIAGIADRALRSVAARGVQPGSPMDALEMDQYSELQEAANILREGVEDLADLVDFATRQNTQVEALLKQQTGVISSIGSSIRAARVVPVSRLIPGLRRLVRTVSVDLNKTVSFQVLNELGTLDRDDYARCQTILDHMVRNALDHGIESADERTAAGKPLDGLVTIDIRKAGADAVITLADDGRGIDPDKMRESAIRKGLDVDVHALSDAEALRLIFHKGFSTASTVSQISGRGVGMDIVLSELQEMGGDIQIESVPGRGTSFHIRVPSSITVNGALLVSAGEQSYAIPLGGLIAVEQVPVADFFAAVHNSTRLSLSGMECEPAYLATLCHNGHSLDAKTWKTSVPVIIAGSPDRYMAIAVDDVEEALELVIRSLGTQFSSVPGVAGAATTASGEAIVALDLNLLVASVGADDESTLHVGAARDEAMLVMVVDDSRTQRMVATSQLETVGVETMTAENGGVAIDLLNTTERLPDIILMDVEMPVKDGIQALREIRKSVRYSHIPVIMITSRTGLKHRAMAQAAGCNGYMGKPFNFRMLVGQINELTGQRLQLS